MRLTDEQKAEVVKLTCDARNRLKDVAAHLGISQRIIVAWRRLARQGRFGAVLQELVGPGLSRRAGEFSAEEKVAVLLEAGQTSVSEVARKYRFSTSTIYRWHELAEAGAFGPRHTRIPGFDVRRRETKRASFTKAEKIRILDEIKASGKSMRAASHEVGIPYINLRKWSSDRRRGILKI